VTFSVALIITHSAPLADIVNQDTSVKYAERLTAEKLASRVLRVNPGLVALEAAAEAAAFRVGPAGSLDDPTLSYSVAPLTADADRSINQRFEVNQKIPWPGTLAARENAAHNNAVAVDRALTANQLRVVAQEKAAYAEWYNIH